jgi:3',5'-cyclic-AMP phosphodiesterase
VVTVNDVHFGETECGRIDDASRRSDHPTLEPGAPPYPEVMNRAAVAEIAELSIRRGDRQGRPVAGRHGRRMGGVRGVLPHAPSATGCTWSAATTTPTAARTRTRATSGFELPGLNVALVDTAIPTRTTGALGEHQLGWIDDHLADVARAGERAIVMGHHQQWIPGADGHERRHDDYFGLSPDASDELDAVLARHTTALGYTAGHTHRHRVRRMAVSGLPSVEIGCVKDFPGTYAEYRVYEGGVMQVVHRISAPEALAWSERCRVLYRDFGIDYVAYALGTLADRCFTIALR